MPKVNPVVRWASEPVCETIAEGVDLWLGNCRDVLAQARVNSFDAAVTDLPYGVGLAETRTKHRSVKGEYDSIVDTEEAVLGLIETAFPLVRRAAPVVALTPGTRMMWAYPRPTDVGCVFFPNGAGQARWGFGCYHPVLYYGNDPYLSNGMGARPNSVSATHWNRRDRPEHPCEKPLKMMLWLVERASLAGWHVLDPFMGSGTTGVACVRLGRRFTGIELSPAYYDAARRRLLEAVKSQGGGLKAKPRRLF